MLYVTYLVSGSLQKMFATLGLKYSKLSTELKGKNTNHISGV